MRILVCASDAPLPPLNGMRLQLRALCEQLARRHEVCVLAYRWPGQEGEPPPGVELLELAGSVPSALDRIVAVARREPVDPRRLARPMRSAIVQLRAQRRFDVAHVMLGELAGVAPALDGLPALIAPLDAWALNVRAAATSARGAERAWRELQLRAVERYVGFAYRPYRRVVLVTSEDADASRRADRSLRTAVIPNGVDAEHFRPDMSVERDERTLLFTGALDAPANEQAAQALVRRVLPRVRAAAPDARLVLAGRSPSAAVAALAGPDVEIVADAPDLRPLLRRAAVFACAMESGTGIKNKLLEAMACGTPAVATPLAAQGLGACDEEQLLIAAAGDRFADAVVRLLDDAAMRARIGPAGREHVLVHHSWSAVAEAYEALYTEIRRETELPRGDKRSTDRRGSGR
jgi:glycosyltransferase involved in cell wall biosynthesis